MSSQPVVLVVEDEPDNREIIRTVIEDFVEYKVLLAEDGRQALEILKDSVPDLILLDLMMPDINGFELARTIRQDPRTADVPIIAVTALIRPKDRQMALESGCTGYVDKPFDLTQLENLVRASVKHEGAPS